MVGTFILIILGLLCFAGGSSRDSQKSVRFYPSKELLESTPTVNPKTLPRK